MLDWWRRRKLKEEGEAEKEEGVGMEYIETREKDREREEERRKKMRVGSGLRAMTTDEDECVGMKGRMRSGLNNIKIYFNKFKKRKKKERVHYMK